MRSKKHFGMKVGGVSGWKDPFAKWGGVLLGQRVVLGKVLEIYNVFQAQSELGDVAVFFQEPGKNYPCEKTHTGDDRKGFYQGSLSSNHGEA